MGMYEDVNSVLKVLREDEQLLRLLHYKPKNTVKRVPDPLEHPDNIKDKPIGEMWDIIDKHIVVTSKSSDLETDSLCRIYVYADARRPTKNYLVANQEVTIDVFCHNDFEKDLRSMRISDRINDLIIHNHVSGFGKMDYLGGSPINAPKDYVAYRHTYVFGNFKK